MVLTAVIVTYNNYYGLIKVIKNLKDQSYPPLHIMIIDNNSMDETVNIKFLFPEIMYIRLVENKGSAGGYSEGLRLAKNFSDFIFLSDDDTVYSSISLENLVKSINSLGEKVGAVRTAWKGYNSLVPEKVESCGWSGVLIRVNVVKVIGLPREDYFLYYDDMEYWLRMKKYNYDFYIIPNTIYLKFFENHQIKTTFFGKYTTIYKDEFRLYYAFRNGVYTALVYKKITQLIRIILYAFKVILILRDFRKTKTILEGISDGMIGRLGRNDKYVVKR